MRKCREEKEERLVRKLVIRPRMAKRSGLRSGAARRVERSRREKQREGSVRHELEEGSTFRF